jgi:uncharacterized membrane protein
MDLKKHWTTVLGVGFLLVAFIYLLRISLDSEWFTPSVKIVIGLVFSVSLLGAGVQFILRKWLISGQLTAGAGVAVSFTTFSFAGIYYDLWLPTTVFFAMIAVTLATAGFSFRLNLRILMNTALIGALIAPMILRPETDQVFTLFLYLLVLNSIYFFVAVYKRWEELTVSAFLGTWVLYFVYYITFNPEISSWWALPMRYAVAAFVFYLIAFAWGTWKLRKTFDGLNIYLGAINGVIFTFVAMIIINHVPNLSIDGSSLVLLFIGGSYLLLAVVMYLLSKRLQISVMIYALGGMLLSLIAGSMFLEGHPYQTVMQVILWTIVSILFVFISKWQKFMPLLYVAQGIWFLVIIYWFVTTWGSTHGDWFGVYIPFMNNGALAWLLLAALGFYFATIMKDGFHHVFGVISHIVLGALLTVQVENIWIGESIVESMTLSVTWGVYALLLFIWGAARKELLYRVFGSIVLGVVAIKAIFFDLWGSETYYKVLALVVLGLISFAITYVNNRYKES